MRKLGAYTAFLLLSACAINALRGSAADLASAGVTTTSTLASDYRTKTEQLRSLDSLEAFTRTYQFCDAVPKNCKPQLGSEELRQQREGLASAVALRGRAVEALGAAYKALQTEAAYDARADMEGATNDAVDAVNAYASAVAAAAPPAAAAALVSEPVKKIVVFGAGLLAAHAQEQRILNDSATIAAATRKLRDALQQEGYIFDGIADYLVTERTAARLKLFDAGLIPSDAGLRPLVDELGVMPAKNADAIVSSSVGARTALEASMEARSKSEVVRAQEAYRTAVSALDELLKGHADLAAKRPLSLADLNRFLEELGSLISVKKEESK